MTQPKQKPLAQPLSSRFVDVDNDLHGGTSEFVVCVTGEGHVEARADCQHQVGILEREVRAARRDRTGASGEKRMIVRDQIHSEPGREDRRFYRCHDAEKFRHRARDANAIASHDDRTFRAREQLDQLAHLLR